MIHPNSIECSTSSTNNQQQQAAETPLSSSDVALHHSASSSQTQTPSTPSKRKPSRRKAKPSPATPTKDMKPLGLSFQPGKLDVICSRGKFAYNSPGNCWFRCMAEEQMDNYGNARTKTEKSLVVSVLVNRVRQANPRGGGFIKNVSGQWYRVNERYSREKVGQQFRDLLHTKYRSSTKAKADKRKKQQDDCLENSVSSFEPESSFGNRSQSERSQQHSMSHTDSPAQSHASASHVTINELDAATVPMMPASTELLDLLGTDDDADDEDESAQQLPRLKLECDDDAYDMDTLGFGDLEPLVEEPSDNENKDFIGIGLDDETFPNLTI